ncbi:hypothetical protein GBA52_023235 [Prunus armeniaca]|nr:hypothetical protein GBA52_023235 [Prunus armeniaca]
MPHFFITPRTRRKITNLSSISTQPKPPPESMAFHGQPILYLHLFQADPESFCLHAQQLGRAISSVQSSKAASLRSSFVSQSAVEVDSARNSALRASRVRSTSRIMASSAQLVDQPPSKTGPVVPTIVDVDLGNRSYPIYIGSGLLDQPELLQRHVHGKKVLVVTNNTVGPLYLDKVVDALTRDNPNVSVESVILPDGEKYKNMDTLMKVFDKAIESRLDRRCTFVALGGGVIGDMCGFAAAAFLRGVNFIQIPTTVMAQNFSCIKFLCWSTCRLILLLGENWYKPPSWEELDWCFLPTPMCAYRHRHTKHVAREELASGFAEVIKHGLIRDAEFFEWQERNIQALMSRYKIHTKEQ